MAKSYAPSVEADFKEVITYFKGSGIIPQAPLPELTATARKIHQSTHSLILWRFRLKGLPKHGRVFIEEIASDALQILPQVLMGFGKPTKLLIRGIIENALRHLYFSDHPVEFERMNRDTKWYISVQELFDYAIAHPIFFVSESKFDSVNRLKTLYDTLSAGVHGRRVEDLEMHVALSKITYSLEKGQKDATSVEKCAEAVNFILTMLHHDSFNRFEAEDKRIILRTLPPKAREIIKDFSA